MIDKIILKDEYDNYFSDLIIFDKMVNRKDLYNILDNTIKEKQNEYTNEDLYEALDKLKISYKIIWLGDVEEFEY